MTTKNIPFGKPQIDENELDAVRAVLESGILVHGKVTPAFEEAFAKRIGTKHAIAVSSCTAGMHLSLFVKKIGAGDKVAVPAMTHVSTAHCVELVGARPEFIDIDLNTGNMDCDILSAVEDDLSAIMPVHYLGLPCDMDHINLIAKKHNAFVIEDCALAMDATYDDKKAGNLGDCGSFSFYPVKHMTSIEGGMVTTNDDDLAFELKKRRAFGYNRALGERVRPGIYDVDALGFNYRMSEVEAAVGLAQMQKLDNFQLTRKNNYQKLYELLNPLDELVIFAPNNGKSQSSYYCLNIILPKDNSINRFDVMDRLQQKNIGFSVHYPSAVPMFSYYREKYDYKSGQFPNAEWLAAQTISLPIAPHIGDEEIKIIVDGLKDALHKSRS